VAKGSSTSLTFEIAPEQLELVGIAGTRAPHPGTHTLEFTNGVAAMATAQVTVE